MPGGGLLQQVDAEEYQAESSQREPRLGYAWRGEKAKHDTDEYHR